MNDKERILTNIIEELRSTMVLAPNPKGFSRKDFTSMSGRTYVHFARYREPKRGDLVLCETIRESRWKVGWYEYPITSSEAMIREIGTSNLCCISNEQFTPIDGMYPESLLEGDQYVLKEKVRKAFHRGREYLYCYGGVEFNKESPRDAIIWIRERFGGFPTNSKPFGIPIHWNKKTTIKFILATMKEQGYGTRKFDKDV